MNRNLCVLVVTIALFPPLPVSAQKRAAVADAEASHIIELERAMWDAWHTRDLATLRALTSQDYVTVNEFGQSTWPEVEAAFGDVVLSGFSLGEIRALRVSKDVIVVSYPAEIHGTYKGTDMSRRVAECSVWRQEKGHWRNVFLHEITVK
jgi:hypothetical protein